MQTAITIVLIVILIAFIAYIKGKKACEKENEVDSKQKSFHEEEKPLVLKSRNAPIAKSQLKQETDHEECVATEETKQYAHRLTGGANTVYKAGNHYKLTEYKTVEMPPSYVVELVTADTCMTHPLVDLYYNLKRDFMQHDAYSHIGFKETKVNLQDHYAGGYPKIFKHVDDRHYEYNKATDAGALQDWVLNDGLVIQTKDKRPA